MLCAVHSCELIYESIIHLLSRAISPTRVAAHWSLPTAIQYCHLQLGFDCVAVKLASEENFQNN